MSQPTKMRVTNVMNKNHVLSVVWKQVLNILHHVCEPKYCSVKITECHMGVVVVEWLSSCLAEQGVLDSIPGITIWI